jgi:citrate lyase subunit beta/citryl-CoA lyase
MSTDQARPRRSVLYLPASNPRAIEKSRDLECDTIVFDLEDAVAPAAKDEARKNLLAAFQAAGFGTRETVIRTNAIGSDDYLNDLQTIATCAPDAVLLPKVSSPTDLIAFARDARQAGLKLVRSAATESDGDIVPSDHIPSGVAVWAMIETVAALTGLHQILEANSVVALDCLVVGTNDIAKETGVSPGNQRLYLMPWLMGIVLAAKQHQISVLDGVWNDFRDTRGFEAETMQSLAMGFDGKTLIHPSQIEPSNRIFSPSAQAIQEAQEIVAAFSLPEHHRAGVINLNGRMVERLHLEQAQRLLAIHQGICAKEKMR